MRAIMYGAGNIGRGFIGSLFAQSGYDVSFIDVAKPVVIDIDYQFLFITCSDD